MGLRAIPQNPGGYHHSKIYLADVLKAQGRCFDYAQDRYPDMDMIDFMSAYLNSIYRDRIDRGDTITMTRFGHELLTEFMAEYTPKPDDGSRLGRGFCTMWIGEMYALLQWHCRVPTREIVKAMPVLDMFYCYKGMHDLDLHYAVQKLLGTYDYNS